MKNFLVMLAVSALSWCAESQPDTVQPEVPEAKPTTRVRTAGEERESQLMRTRLFARAWAGRPPYRYQGRLDSGVRCLGAAGADVCAEPGQTFLQFNLAVRNDSAEGATYDSSCARLLTRGGKTYQIAEDAAGLWEPGVSVVEAGVRYFTPSTTTAVISGGEVAMFSLFFKVEIADLADDLVVRFCSLETGAPREYLYVDVDHVASARATFSTFSTVDDSRCCRVCDGGKPCGDTCIDHDATCHVAPGCACEATGETQ